MLAQQRQAASGQRSAAHCCNGLHAVRQVVVAGGRTFVASPVVGYFARDAQTAVFDELLALFALCSSSRRVAYQKLGCGLLVGVLFC